MSELAAGPPNFKSAPERLALRWVVLALLTPFACGAVLTTAILLGDAMLAVVFVAGVVCLLHGLTAIPWRSSRAVQLRFAVIDADTWEPIEGAVVRVGRMDDDLPAAVYTDKDGLARFSLPCRIHGTLVFYVLVWRVRVCFRGWEFEVWHPGYRGTGAVPMTRYTGRDLPTRALNMPPLVIELERQAVLAWQNN